MYCRNCGNETRKNDKFCSSCGNELSVLSEVASTVEIKTGDSSINIASGNGNKVEIESFYAQVNTERKADILQYEWKQRGRTVKDNVFKNTKNTVISLGTIGTILSIVSSSLGIAKNGFGNNSSFIFGLLPISLAVILLGFFLHIYYRDLIVKGFIWVKPNSLVNMKFKHNNDGTISRLDIWARCPKCSGKIKLYKNSEDGKIIGYCQKNSEHRYSFDHTDFTGKAI